MSTRIIQIPGAETPKNTEVCLISLCFCGIVGYIKQGVFLGDTVISSACIDKHQQLKVSKSNKLANFMEQSPSCKLTGLQIIKEFPEIYGTQRFITAFTSDSLLSLSSTRTIQTMPLPSQFWKIHFNIMLCNT